LLGIGWGGFGARDNLLHGSNQASKSDYGGAAAKNTAIFAALLAWLLLGERLGKHFWICLWLALVRAYVVNFGLARPGRDGREAALLAIAAAALWGASTVLGRFVLDSVSFFALTGLRILVATPFLIVLNGARSLPVAIDFRQACRSR